MNARQINEAMTLVTDSSRGMDDADKLSAILQLEEWFQCGIIEIIETLK